MHNNRNSFYFLCHEHRTWSPSRWLTNDQSSTFEICRSYNSQMSKTKSMYPKINSNKAFFALVTLNPPFHLLRHSLFQLFLQFKWYHCHFSPIHNWLISMHIFLYYRNKGNYVCVIYVDYSTIFNKFGYTKLLLQVDNSLVARNSLR